MAAFLRSSDGRAGVPTWRSLSAFAWVSSSLLLKVDYGWFMLVMLDLVFLGRFGTINEGNIRVFFEGEGEGQGRREVGTPGDVSLVIVTCAIVVTDDSAD